MGRNVTKVTEPCWSCQGVWTTLQVVGNLFFWERASIVLNLRKNPVGTALVVQWLRLCAPNAGGPGSIPGQGTRSRMLQLKARMLQLKDPEH